MTSVLWYLGRALQILGLVVTGAALFLGLQSHDATQELKIMLVGVVQFLLGLLLLKYSGAPQE